MQASIPQAASFAPLPRNWSRKRFNRELKRFRTSQADQVRKTGFSQSLVSMVISSQATSLPCATALAAAVGRTPWEIWPRIYRCPETAPATSTDAATTEPTGQGPRSLAS